MSETEVVYPHVEAVTLDHADLEGLYDKLYDDICGIGAALAEAGGFELPDEWPNLVRDWLLKNHPGIIRRGVTKADVQQAFDAWEIGARREEGEQRDEDAARGQGSARTTAS